MGQKLTFIQKHNGISSYESILFELDEDPDELDDFCEALVIGWRLLPDAWTGLLMMIDYLAERMLTSDLEKIKLSTLVVIKEIAKNKHWPNSAICGQMMYGSQAKTILARVS